jgi:hypothetical protein
MNVDGKNILANVPRDPIRKIFFFAGMRMERAIPGQEIFPVTI